MNMEKYEELLKGFAPEDEEQNRDYQRAVQASMRMRYLQIPTIVADDVYDRMYSEIEKNNDREQIEQFERDYISESEYDRQYHELADILEEIDNKYGITQEQNETEFEQEVKQKRSDLRALQVYGEENATYIMRNVDVENLSANEVIGMHARIFYASNLSTASLEEQVRIGNEIIAKRERDAILDPIRRRVGNRSVPTPDPIPVPPEPTPSDVVDNDDSDGDMDTPDNEDEFERTDGDNGGTDGDVTADEIEAELNQFRETSDRINKQIQTINRTLVLDDEVDFSITEAINGLGNELKELREMAEVIIADMDEFRLSTESEDFSMSVVEIRNTIKGFTERLKNLKVLQREKYNARVELTNAKIRELKELSDLEPEVAEMISNLTELEMCDITIGSWNQMNYLKQIDYNKLIEVNKVIAEINGRLGREIPVPKVEGLDGDIEYIEEQLKRYETEIVEDMDETAIIALKQNLDDLSTNIENFKLKLENNKDSLSEEEYNAYIERVKAAEEKLEELRNRLSKNVKLSNDYAELEKTTSDVERETDRLVEDVLCFEESLTKGGVEVLENRAETLEGRVSDLKNDIEARHVEKKIDDNQYNALMERIAEVEKKLSMAREKLRDLGMIKDADIFAVLNGEIDGLEGDLTELETQIDRLEKPIKRADRKNIDAIIKHLESEIKRLEKLLEQYKDKDPEKYKATKERLNSVKDRLNKVSKEYRKKCPLLVRAVKEAKNFFKKHQKKILIIAGLAAFALVAHQVLIPAIMHGNIMIARMSPALNSFAKFTNKILGGMINATLVDNVGWSLANGVIINPSMAATSLLKGLAVSGIGTTALVAPLVVAIKKLVDKMKTSELKQKLAEEHEKMKKKKNDGKEKLKEKTKKTDKKESKKNFDKLYKEFLKSGKSLEDFCKEENLSEKEMEILGLKAKLDEALKETSGKRRGR